MDDEDDQTYFDASSITTPPAPNPGAAPSSAPFEDNGEPDFGGWLAAQNQAKSKSALTSKKPLPKGLTKSSSSTSTIPSRPITTNGRTAATGSVGSDIGAKKPANTTVSKSAVMAAQVAAKKKKIDTRPKEATEDQGDDWGAWD
ncbi:MAG: hypothetical protein ACRYGR_02170 [Janthinobacterium lividum]